jgi:hypothetical protein
MIVLVIATSSNEIQLDDLTIDELKELSKKGFDIQVIGCLDNTSHYICRVHPGFFLLKQ